jgi:hypothetical protein
MYVVEIVSLEFVRVEEMHGGGKSNVFYAFDY